VSVDTSDKSILGKNPNLNSFQNPTEDYDTFRLYVAQLNSLIVKNMPFLKAQFRITSLQIYVILTDSILPNSMKKKYFDTKIARASVIVQYTQLADFNKQETTFQEPLAQSIGDTQIRNDKMSFDETSPDT